MALRQQLPFRLVAAVVPCPAGWLVVSARLQGVTLLPEQPMVVERLADAIDYRPTFEVIVLGVPVGLPETPVGGYRACDREARQLLGWPRRATVARVPSRAALHAASFEAALAIEPWLTPLAYRHFPWLREVEQEIQPYHQRRVFSGLPELSYHLLNGDAPLATSGHWADGNVERLALANPRFPGIDAIAGSASLPPGTDRRLVADAASLLWTARRIAGHVVSRLPEMPEWDDTGLRMELVR